MEASVASEAMDLKWPLEVALGVELEEALGEAWAVVVIFRQVV